VAEAPPHTTPTPRASNFTFLVDADACLHPSRGVFDPDVLYPYTGALRDALLPGYRPGMTLSLVVQPSFRSSYLVYMETSDPEGRARPYRVVLRRMRADTWQQMMDEMHRQQGDTIHLGEKRQQAALARVKTTADEYVAPVDDTTGELLRKAWEGVVSRTQYPREVLQAPDGSGVLTAKMDGTEYSFWANGQSGVTHSPDRGSLLADFVRLGETLGTFVEASEASRATMRQTLVDQATALITRAARNESCVKPYERR
jgi:hypothetical protein